MKSRTRRKGLRKGGRTLRTEPLEARMLLVADLPMMTQNADMPLDANGDGEVSTMDVLVLVNEMNRTDRGGPNAPRFADVNGDQVLSPLDPLMVINELNRRSAGQGGGRPDGDTLLEPRTIDGTGNNIDMPDWGSAGIEFIRQTTVEYGDGISTPAGEGRASAREISNLVAAQSESEPNARGMSDLVWQWGQFLDHDLDLALTLSDVGKPIESLPIEVPTGDPFFDPFATGNQTIGLTRSNYADDSGDSVDNPRAQMNSITAFVDASNVYGSDDVRAAALRTFDGGRLKTSDGNLLPFNVDGLDNAGGTSSSLFLAGDVRANEQVGLTAMHTLWVREHNRLADELAERHPNLSDEEIYQRARATVIAEMQVITYNEFLPALLGPHAIGLYRGYDPTVNPSISNVFATAAYRFGHSMLSPELLRLDNDGQVIEDGNLALRDAFFRPDEIIDNGIDSLLLGLASQRAQEIDSHVVDDVRNFLFGPPGSGGFDLPSLNIQRGRDHGLADYNQTRVDFGLDPVTSFADITSDPDLQAALSAAYDGDVNNVDAWVGILAEDHARGAAMGELASTIISDQFTRLRDGDRYWYQNTLSRHDQRRIEKTTLADVLRRNTEVTDLQRNVFFVPDARPNQPHRGGRAGDPGPPPWFDGLLADGLLPNSQLADGGNAPRGPGSQTEAPLPASGSAAESVASTSQSNGSENDQTPSGALVGGEGEGDLVGSLFPAAVDEVFGGLDGNGVG